MKDAVDIVQASDSTILRLIVVVAIVVLAMLPLISKLAKIQEKRRDFDYERERHLIQVIQSNTEVNVALKSLIESDQKNCADCKNEQLQMFRDIQTDSDSMKLQLHDIHVAIVRPK